MDNLIFSPKISLKFDEISMEIFSYIKYYSDIFNENLEAPFSIYSCLR